MWDYHSLSARQAFSLANLVKPLNLLIDSSNGLEVSRLGNRSGNRKILADGESGYAVRRLAGISAEASPETIELALVLVREVVPSLSAEELGGILGEVPGPAPVLPPIQVEYGMALYFQGGTEEARGLGTAALESGASGRDEELARALASGRVEDALGEARTIGAILPSSGPPTLSRFGTLLEEGIRIALSGSVSVVGGGFMKT